MRLADLIGQDTARTALLRAIERGHLAHAYLFEGPPGVGKRSAAHGLAMALNCPTAPGDGCGACDVCRRIDAGLHPDVPTFGPSGAGGQIVIDAAQAILALARSRPHEAAARVIVIDDADAMNPSAANCLLKTLEEPLARNHLVLCTSAPDRLLPTIRSRTQRVRFRPLPAAQLLELARRHGIPAAAPRSRSTLADGSAARLLALAVEDDGGGRGAGAGGAAGGGQPPGRRAGVRLRRRAGERQAGQGGQGRSRAPARSDRAPLPRRDRARGRRAGAGGAARQRRRRGRRAGAGGAGRRTPEPRARGDRQRAGGADRRTSTRRWRSSAC